MNSLHKYGALRPKIDIRDYRYKPAATMVFPEEYELEKPCVKNQGSICSCVAHALSSIIEYHHKRQQGTEEGFSVGFLYGCRPYEYQGAGLYLRDALSVACKYGDVKERDFPYNEEVPGIIDRVEQRLSDLKKKAAPNRISCYARVETDSEIKSALKNNGPVLINIPVYHDLTQNSKGEILLYGKVQGYHCVLIYGWTSSGWKILNSWGSQWGNNGSAILKYEYPIEEAWSVTDDIINVGKMPFSETFNIFYKIINKVLNWRSCK